MPGNHADLQRRLEALFLEELQDNLDVLGRGLTHLGEVGASDDLVRQLFRAAHSLKGAAHSAGIADAVAPCTRLEEVFAEVRDRRQPVDATVLSELGVEVSRLVEVERRLRRPVTAQGDRDEPASGGATDEAPRLLSAGVDARARVNVERLDRLVERSASLVTTAHRFRSWADDLETATSSVVRAGRRSHRSSGGASDEPTLAALVARAREMDRHLRALADQLAGNAQALRLQRFQDVTAGLDNAVREVARATDTEVGLVLRGEEVELDRDVGDALREPLLHLVRNAVDHGIEGPSTRVAAGKPAAGTVSVSAADHGNMVMITVDDDGAGVDTARLRSLLGREPSTVGDDDDDIELAFAPGLSTASEVTEVSGRGIGLDAARARVESLGGTFHLRSERGIGTHAEIQVPRTLAVLHVLIVDVGTGGLIALPLAAVTRLHRVADGHIEHLEGRLTVAVGGRRRPAVHLASAIGLADTAADGSTELAVEVADEDGMLLLRRAVTTLEVVLRPLPSLLGQPAGLLGTTLLPTGEPVLVANPAAALRNGLSLTVAPPPARPPSRRRRVLLVEDTPTTRALERSILESAGYEVVVAVDGVDALDRLRGGELDAIVTDVDMPRLNGIELCRMVRASIHHRDLPVILVTSLGNDEDRKRGLDAGADAYLVKSAFDQTTLLDALGRLL